MSSPETIRAKLAPILGARSELHGRIASLGELDCRRGRGVADLGITIQDIDLLFVEPRLHDLGIVPLGLG